MGCLNQQIKQDSKLYCTQRQHDLHVCQIKQLSFLKLSLTHYLDFNTLATNTLGIYQLLIFNVQFILFDRVIDFPSLPELKNTYSHGNICMKHTMRHMQRFIFIYYIITPARLGTLQKIYILYLFLYLTFLYMYMYKQEKKKYCDMNV